ncbi:MAG: transposase [Proteobacteria bacterium]|nr:MAG: transposase [Pseudomonadota bacterium]
MCSTDYSSITEIKVLATVDIANAGPDIYLCNLNGTVQLAANTPTNGVGEWQQISGPIVTFADKNDAKTSITITQTGDYSFSWTIGNGVCKSTSLIKLHNYPALVNTVQGGTNTYCSGQSVAIIGAIPTGGKGFYYYAWESSVDQTSWATVAGATEVSLNFNANQTAYFRRKVDPVKPPGRSPPGFTVNRDGATIFDHTIVTILKEYRSSIEFANGGGARKLASYLGIEHHIYINHKKIYRLCVENDLLLFRQHDKNKRKFKKKRCEYLEVSLPNQLWQFDLKYIWIHGENHWCFFLGFIDVISKKVTGWYVGKTCKAGDLVFTLDQAIKNEGITHEHALVVRSDNGPQMSSNRFHFF